MFKIKITDSIETLGLITFQIRKDGDILIREGLLKTHLYVEEIDTLECDRFRLEGIDVYAEAFGSSDIFNLYTFTYELFSIKETGEGLSEEELILLYKKELN